MKGDISVEKKQANNETVRLLCNVLRSLMKTKKIEKISVNEIALKANIHRVTFYYYFQDKYELLHHIFNEDIERIAGESRSENILGVIIELFEYLVDNEKLYNNAFASDDYQSLKGVYLAKTKIYFEEIVNNLSSESELIVRKDYLIDFYSNAATSFIINWLKNPKRENYDEAAKQMVMMIEHGFIKCIGK